MLSTSSLSECSDYRREVTRVLVSSSSRLRMIIPVYIIAMEGTPILKSGPTKSKFGPLANYTWLLADFSVSLMVITYRYLVILERLFWTCFVLIRMTKLKDRTRRAEYWKTNVCFQGVKNILQSVLAPIGAVVGTLMTASTAGTLVGYNAAELVLNASVEYAVVTYRSH